MAFIGIDIGTTGCKTCIYEKNGTLLETNYIEYSCVKKLEPGRIDANFLFDCVKGTIINCHPEKYTIEAISLASFGETFVLLDENGEPLMDCFIHNSGNSDIYLNKIVDSVSKKRITEITGLEPSSTYSITKIFEIKNEQPELFEKVDKIHLMADYIIYRLTKKHYIDYTLASRTMCFDIYKKEFSKEILDKLGITCNLFPIPEEHGTDIGIIDSEIAKTLNISDKTRVILGCHDQVAVLIGSGASEIGEALNGSGTVECITPIFDTKKATNTSNNHYCLVPLNNKSVTYAYSYNGGSLLKWFRDEIANEEFKQLASKNIDFYDYFNQLIRNIETPLLVLPYFSGAATPYMDNNIRGAILNLSLNSTKADIFLALMESVAFEVRYNIETLKKCNIDINKIYSAGGGTNSDKRMQIKADVLNMNITALRKSEVGIIGCIILAITSLDKNITSKDLSNIFIKNKIEFIPNKSKVEYYENKYKKYLQIYKSLKQIK